MYIDSSDTKCTLATPVYATNSPQCSLLASTGFGYYGYTQYADYQATANPNNSGGGDDGLSSAAIISLAVVLPVVAVLFVAAAAYYYFAVYLKKAPLLNDTEMRTSAA